MHHLDRISAIESRAAEHGLSLRGLCLLVKRPNGRPVYWQNVGRWKAGKVSPQMRTLKESLDALEAALDARDAELLAKLQARAKAKEAPEARP